MKSHSLIRRADRRSHCRARVALCQAAGVALLGLLLSVPGPHVCAQAAPPAPAKPATPAVQSVNNTDYRLAADDTISVSVVNFPELNAPSVVIPPDGRISLNLLDPIDVTGKTPNELRQLLADKWNKFVVNPVVNVTLSSKRKESIRFYGFIGHAGTTEYRPGTRLLSYLTEFGGPATNGDLSKVTVTHPNGDKQVLDLHHPEIAQGTESDIVLGVNDVVYIPERRLQFSVFGEVAKPGSYDYKDDMTIVDAITEVGSYNKETADLRGATITHNGLSSKLDLNALYIQRDERINAKITPGDVIYVPEKKDRVYVAGAVGKVGYYFFKPDDRIMDALGGIGGYDKNANIKHITLVHIDRTDPADTTGTNAPSSKVTPAPITNGKSPLPKKGTPVIRVVNLENYLKKGDLNSNPLLVPGDSIYIPDKKSVLTWRDALSLGGITSFFYLFR